MPDRKEHDSQPRLQGVGGSCSECMAHSGICARIDSLRREFDEDHTDFKTLVEAMTKHASASTVLAKQVERHDASIKTYEQTQFSTRKQVIITVGSVGIAALSALAVILSVLLR
jgi:hypothetical protein